MIQHKDPFENFFGGDQPPPPKTQRCYEIISAKPGIESSVLLTSTRLTQVRTHYVGGESKPHVAKGRCPWCEQRFGLRWKAYGCGVHPISGKAVLVEVTLNAVHTLPALVDPGNNLRGRLLKLYRRGQSPRSPVMARFDQLPPSLAKMRLPPAFDLQAALFALWRLSEDDLRRLGWDRPEDGGAAVLEDI